MANMSYCRFQNTLLDLEDCLEALQEEMKTVNQFKAGKKI